MTKLKNKRTQILITVAVAALLVIAATFAWSSFAQQRINTFSTLERAGVHLHDDFDTGPNKDVYVENAGTMAVYVRVKLTEFMQTEQQGSLVDGQTGEDENARQWAPHNGLDSADTCRLVAPYKQSMEWGGTNFHDYFTWKMGGFKYYMPAKYIIDEVPEGEEPPVCVDLAEYTEEQFNDAASHVAKTLDATVITMAQWVADGYPQGNIWVVDTDGWCYWASPLQPNEATGLLLDSLEWKVNDFETNTDYFINVWLQAVDKTDINLFENEALSEGATAEGMALMRLISGDAVTDELGVLYIDNKNGTYTMVRDADGNSTPDAKTFIPLGGSAYGNGATAMDAVTADGRLYIGDTFSLNEMKWNGEGYTDYESFNVNPPYYNITPSGMGYSTGEYTALGVEFGKDGVPYIKIEDNSENEYSGDLYIASVQKTEGGEFTQTPPGVGPFALIYAPDSPISEGEYLRYNPAALEERYFHHIGSGVYVEVVDKSETESKDSPVIYYFAGEIFNSSNDYHSINNLGSNTIEEIVEGTFPLQLKVGDSFDLIFETNETTGETTITGIQSDGTMFTMEEVEIVGGNVYIPMGDGQYIGPGGEDGVIGGGGGLAVAEIDGEGNVTVIATPMPSGGEDGNPYLIKNRLDMNWVSGQLIKGNTFAGKTLTVANDFSMGADKFTPIGSSTTQFMGVFDGGGKTISGLKIDRTADYTGLFGYIGAGGTVKNVKLENAVVTGKQYTGGIAGQNDGTVTGCAVTGSGLVTGTITNAGGVVGYNIGTVEKCFNTASVTALNMSVGGVAGFNKGTIEQCYADLTGIGNKKVYGENYNVGGVVGYNCGLVRNCYMWGDVVGGANSGSIGGIIGVNLNNNPSEVFNVYQAKGSVVGNKDVGGVLGYKNNVSIISVTNAVALSVNISGTDFVNRVVGRSYVASLIKNTYAWTGTTVNGATVASGDANGVDVSTQTPDWSWWVNTAKFPADVWTIDLAEGSLPVLRWEYPGLVPPEIQDGSEEHPFLITKWQDLLQLKDATAGQFYKITNSFSLSGLTDPITGFAGTLDGGGWTLSGLNLTGGSSSVVGLFTTLPETGRVENVTLSDVNISGGAVVGAIAGMNMGGAINNCQVLSGAITSGDGQYGIGGLVGNNTGTVESCSNAASVTNTGGDYTGGVVGQNGIGGTVEASNNTGAVTGVAYTGGVAGQNSGTVQSCSSVGAITGGNLTGGVVGQNAGTAKDCYAWGNVESTGVNIGGVAGSNSGAVSNVYHAKGYVKGASVIGGVFGINEAGTLKNAVALADSIKFTTRTNVNRLVGNFSAANAITNRYAYTGMQFLLNEAASSATQSGNASRHGEDVATQTPDWETFWTTTAGFSTVAWEMGGDGLPVLTGELASDESNAMEGAGTSLAPFLITANEHLDLLKNAKKNVYYKLMQDLTMTGNTTSIANFGGILDGNGKTITNFQNSQTGQSNRGLFQIITADGIVKNLKLANVTVQGASNVGAIAGTNNGTIENCHVLSGKVTSTDNHIGGLAGINNGMVQKSSNSATVTGTTNGSYTGGIVGRHYGTVENCYNTGNVTALNGFYVGGIAGCNEQGALIQYTYNTGNVSALSDCGGLIGSNYISGNAKNSVALNCTVTAAPKIGRVCGANSATITDCYNYNVTCATSAGVDGLGASKANIESESWWRNTLGFTAANWPVWDSAKKLPTFTP